MLSEHSQLSSTVTDGFRNVWLSRSESRYRSNGIMIHDHYDAASEPLAR